MSLVVKSSHSTLVPPCPRLLYEGVQVLLPASRLSPAASLRAAGNRRDLEPDERRHSLSLIRGKVGQVVNVGAVGCSRREWVAQAGRG